MIEESLPPASGEPDPHSQNQQQQGEQQEPVPLGTSSPGAWPGKDDDVGGLRGARGSGGGGEPAGGGDGAAGRVGRRVAETEGYGVGALGPAPAEGRADGSGADDRESRSITA